LATDSALKAKIEKFVNENLLTQGQGITAEITKVAPYDNYLDEVTINIRQNGTIMQTVPLYASPDGKTIVVGQAFRTNETIAKQTPSATTPAATKPVDVKKLDKPVGNGFVMAFCPYGLQFLKAYVPVIELLGNKSDLQVNFVSYAMHGYKEIEGNEYMDCIQKNDKPKFTAYLRCAVEAGDYKGCVATTGIDVNKTASCVAALDKQYNITGLFDDKSTWLSGYYPQYPVQNELNTLYGVQGSPTFVLNGAQVDVWPRTANNLKNIVCSGFKVQPAECNVTLSTADEQAGVGKIGVGTGTASAGTATSCG
ncbi:MAG: hypothetical protein NT051_02400, partial [Candidatus Micrarchaeota archaeon]|nr:hypothetical protein [Candidatus Micrarchaeota archaeon]